MQQHEALTFWLIVLSTVSFFGTLIVVPILLARLPSDYFLTQRRGDTALAVTHPILRLFVGVAKNALGFCLILAGIIMLVIPGQGLLTIAVGLMLMNFPGKFRMEQWLVSRPRVFRAINWIRQRADQPPILIAELEASDGIESDQGQSK